MNGVPNLTDKKRREKIGGLATGFQQWRPKKEKKQASRVGTRDQISTLKRGIEIAGTKKPFGGGKEMGYN